MTFKDDDERAIMAIRLLAADATFNGKSGHPRAPIYETTMDVLKNFRQLGSITPGHPENFETPGIEVTTGPLGQGIANAVGRAIAQAHTAAVFNRPGFSIVDNFTYCFLGDDCLQEGVAPEASPLAGHLQLGNLICIYDANRITIDGNINCSFTEDVVKLYESYGWHVVVVEDGNTDLATIEAVIQQCKEETTRPSIIKLRITIGYGSLEEGTHGVHGNPLKADDIKQLKSKWGFNADEAFHVPEENSLLAKYADQFPELHADLQRRPTGTLPQGWEAALPSFSPSDPAVATRKLSETVLFKIHVIVPGLIGGSSDLTPSNLTRWASTVDFQAPGLEDVPGGYSGRYLRYGLREHAMSAIMNGLAPIETLVYFRAMPKFSVWRPADGNETSAAYLVSLKSMSTPSILALSRQNLPQLRGSSVEKASRGGYVVSESDSSADITLIGTGLEVALCVETVGYRSEQHGLKVRVVSLPCWEVFDAQSEDYKRSALGSGMPSLSVEVLSTVGWQRWTHKQFGIDTFGASTPADVLFAKFEFIKEGVAKRAIATIEFFKKKSQSIESPLDRAF
ncbi:hypothetical protein MRS44_002441 [Fusarium solani]|uniref:uncharacterized protein n=1 Tax=Fusarium solani TaxID=169388 RepID=UPI0032C47C1D|nr:hypothetical protein MRS44_002441 [Fusarium solani]